jgi:putative nucleotidyltransferase with HDIG domain
MLLSFSFYKQPIKPKKCLMAAARKPVTPAEKVVTDIMYLFETHGTEDYDGEPVSQASHMIQCAMLAMESISDLPVIIGALLHDIGHLLKHEQPIEAMGSYGVVNHEGIGAGYLQRKGFSEHVCAIVEHHVAAKRYLVTADKTYKDTLSPASLQTLRLQGGPMTPEEMAAFEKHPYFTDIINVRRWDEQAKNTRAVLLPVVYFRKIILDHLWYRINP